MTNYGARDLARSFRTVRKNTRQIADEIPEEQYSFRAAEGTRTVAELLAHVAAYPGWQHQLHGRDRKTFVAPEDFGAYVADANRFAATLATKAAILAALDTQGESFAAFLESLSDTDLNEVVSFPPPLEPAGKTRFEMLLGVKEHEMHHRAQLMLLQRMIGLVPHVTRRRQQR
jgi:uncharacterized damage-inducible protein DinB